MRLNPYCSGRWPRTKSVLAHVLLMVMNLNPYCSGRWSRTHRRSRDSCRLCQVLILIVVEDGLVPKGCATGGKQRNVLILVVVEDGLVPDDWQDEGGVFILS